MRMLVNVRLFKTICIHPENDTYPIFSLLSDRVSFEYQVHFDH
jgi:hypothetical protein